MPNEKIVVLSSGGLNSAVVSSIAAKENTIAAMHVRYGDRAAQRGEEMFERQADHFEIRERIIIDMPHFTAIGAGARLSRKLLIEDAMALGERESNCYVPGLIGALVSAAFTYARHIGASKIMLGVCENLGPPAPKTCTIYPDYSRDYVQLCNHLLAVASPHRAIRVEAPLVELSRTEIVKLGRRLETPFELTWSCISSGTQCCGACVGCATRNRGFLDAAVPDPLFLQAAAR